MESKVMNATMDDQSLKLQRYVQIVGGLIGKVQVDELMRPLGAEGTCLPYSCLIDHELAESLRQLNAEVGSCFGDGATFEQQLDWQIGRLKPQCIAICRSFNNQRINVYGCYYGRDYLDIYGILEVVRMPGVYRWCIIQIPAHPVINGIKLKRVSEMVFGREDEAVKDLLTETPPNLTRLENFRKPKRVENLN